MGILVKIETFTKNKHSHIDDIGVFAYLQHYFLKIPKSLGR